MWGFSGDSFAKKLAQMVGRAILQPAARRQRPQAGLGAEWGGKEENEERRTDEKGHWKKDESEMQGRFRSCLCCSRK